MLARNAPVYCCGDQVGVKAPDVVPWAQEIRSLCTLWRLGVLVLRFSRRMLWKLKKQIAPSEGYSIVLLVFGV